ncbi:hypothetical protein [Marinoscillum pacificum]|uniref:hypothetical protein n=1 Tax=Marinoscillum pacificum TaxID=392723 RepID=UPI0021586AE1|nr:hypothetical protein [Marinoscillum pacificum]
MPLILKYLIVFALSAVKIIFGPTLGLAYGFSIIETTLLSLGGMMTTVYLFSYFGPQMRRLTQRIFSKRKKKRFSKKTRRFAKIWRAYGVPGIAFFTPILLSPPGGAILANAFGGKRGEIIKWMWIFGTLWSIILTLLVKYAGDLLAEYGII